MKGVVGGSEDDDLSFELIGELRGFELKMGKSSCCNIINLYLSTALIMSVWFQVWMFETCWRGDGWVPGS